MSLPAAPLASEVRAVLAAVTSAVVVVDSEARILFLNERAVELFGHHESELIARPVEVVLPLGVVAGEQHSGVRRDGSRFPAEVSLTPLETAHGCQTILAVRDITGRRQREKRDADVSRAYLSLVAMYDAIVRARDEEGLLAETCRIAVEEAGYLGAWVVRIDEDGVVHKVASAGNLDAFLEQRQLTLDPAEPEGNGTTARALLEGRPVFSSELHGDPTTSAMRALAYAAGIRASATLPLRRDGRTVAVMTLYTDVPDFFDGEMRALVEAVSENVALALERFVAADRLRAVAAQRHELARRLVGAQEEERARIAADVHDDSVQSLAAADLRLGLLSRQLAEVAPDLVPGVELVQQTVASVSSGLRDLLFDLESTDTSQPLHSIVPGVADHLFEDSDLSCEVTVDLT
ncbi:MAG: GAF domain-containing protein, partial [Marmoricola sp.]